MTREYGHIQKYEKEIKKMPKQGMAPIILAVTGYINVSRIIIAAILTFSPVSTNVLARFNFHVIHRLTYIITPLYEKCSPITFSPRLSRGENQ